MNLVAIAAALKAKYRPVFRGGVEREVRRYAAMAEQAREAAQELTGPGRAMSAIVEGKGE